MHSRSVVLVIVLILGFVVCLGCTDSGDESQESISSEEIHTGATQEEAETLQANQSINLSSEVEWESNYRNGCFLLASDYESISSAANNGDYVSLEKAGSKLESDARVKLEESQMYQLLPSSTRQYGKSEYEAALIQFIEAGKYYSYASRKMQDGDNTGSAVDLQTALACQNLASEHMQNILTYYPDQNSMGATKSGTNSGEVIASWSGNSIKDTETFHVSSDEWRITWNTKPGEYGVMNFQIYVYNSDGTLKSVAANVIGESSDYSIIRGSGDYYLSINSAQPYEITAESLN